MKKYANAIITGGIVVSNIISYFCLTRFSLKNNKQYTNTNLHLYYYLPR